MRRGNQALKTLNKQSNINPSMILFRAVLPQLMCVGGWLSWTWVGQMIEEAGIWNCVIGVSRIL
jgi:hypothetical protein